MRFTTKLSAFMTLLVVLAMCLVLLGSTISFFYLCQKKMEQRLQSIVTAYDQSLLLQPINKKREWLPLMMQALGVVDVSIKNSTSTLYQLHTPAVYTPWNSNSSYRQMVLPLLHQPGTDMHFNYIDPLGSYARSIYAAAILSLVVVVIALTLLLSFRWLRDQTVGQEKLERRARRILSGEREHAVRSEDYEWPPCASRAIDHLLSELMEVRAERNRVDTLIRTFAAQDAQTGLSNRQFFDNQLTTQLEETGAHGVVMMVQLPDFEALNETHDHQQVQELMGSLVNLLSTFVARYPSALLARYLNSDIAILLPHKTLKDADVMAAQLVNAVRTLPEPHIIDRESLLHIGIVAYRSGESAEQIMDNAGQATKNAALYGGNGWYVYDTQVPERGRGSVKWRTLLEQTLASGGPRLYQKPVITVDGKISHREIISRIYDGKQELLAAEFMPLVQLLGLGERYDRQKIDKIIPLLSLWPDETLAFSISVDSLLHRPFQRWLRDTLLQCKKSDRMRIIFELAEADVCQHIEEIRQMVRLLRGLGCKVMASQAGLTVVSTSYIKSLQVEMIKLHPGVVRSINFRYENQLFVESLTGACAGAQTKVFAAEVRTREEWQTLQEKGVYGGQGNFFAPPTPLNSGKKKYS
ncbi:RNase E specificity factor CsrD [Yersinia similis]|uniref:Regulatory protein CsrD n=1 Tax=Yersinia similis TaxID=367190 RepID=A0A0T9RFN5_9GAMM|nr:RNase E specificity factor CsrD [Yersinia similis]AHK18834.1 regulatory protein CsrD [Yersinia similis]CFQ57513.1 regulatory protein CsrD [Yersinia similis]CNB78002.1 regulatory protein CsrD [Yersinia similis]CNF13189.1 regulatory protein CsrD [Yersinia similis]CNG17171.1 regulatory protein CsrD [Yersinia similis]